jgi:serine/threonine protein kinase
MDYVDGGSLLSLLQSQQQISLLNAMQFVFDISQGLSHLHTNKIIHRDLAARNVLIRLPNDSNNRKQCVLTDMGK